MRTVGLIGLCTVFSGALGCSSSSTTTTVTKDTDSGTHSDATSATPDTGAPDAAKTTVPDASVTPDSSTPVHDSSVSVLDAGHDADRTDSSTVTHDAATTSDAHVDSPTTTKEGGTGSLPDAGAAAVHALITFGGSSTSEMVSVNLTSKAIEGRLPFPGVGVTDTRNTLSPFLLEQNADVVAKLNSTKPWTVDSTWNVAMTDAIDGGSLYSDPAQVVVETETKAYVLRTNRNDIAVINETSDSGIPTSSISIASFLQTGDTDGVVEMTAAAYVPATSRLYVVLANVNQNDEAAYGATICGSEVSTVIAINTLTDTVVSLGGTGPGGSIPLVYYNPMTAVFDATGDRLIVASAGCNAKPTAPGGALGAVSGRGVEAVNLTTDKSASLLSITASAFPAGFVDIPTGFAYIDSTHAIIGFDGTGQAVYNWNPTSTTIGALIPNAPDVFVYDGNGHLVGTRVDTPDAGGASSTDIVSVTVPAGVSTTLAKNVTSLTGLVYVSSVDVWPHP